MIVKLNQVSDHQLNQILKIWLNGNLDAHDFIPKNCWMDNYDNVKNLLPKA
ncbi:hypothetical protein WR164_02560 [Philodulcilactobacillus myokoensis]|uniref:Acetyltransferase n=1 Tax=Philodulcilactobacillus myokoensis TaxID=2929573 RepID=A0A9W6AZC4_9LACO|nr:hypothetical protein WR164_02560 [Philodulcilactobacillus myokoensis]